MESYLPFWVGVYFDVMRVCKHRIIFRQMIYPISSNLFIADISNEWSRKPEFRLNLYMFQRADNSIPALKGR